MQRVANIEQFENIQKNANQHMYLTSEMDVFNDRATDEAFNIFTRNFERMQLGDDTESYAKVGAILEDRLFQDLREYIVSKINTDGQEFFHKCNEYIAQTGRAPLPEWFGNGVVSYLFKKMDTFSNDWLR